jgi:hypothetical protein
MTIDVDEKIKTYVIPKHLYRYRSLANFEREMESIQMGYVYCSKYGAMNDPMEGFYSTSKLLEGSPELTNLTTSIFLSKSSIGICSFSEVFNHELMWAHYADQFRGICVAYDCRHLASGVTFSRVYYSEETPQIGHSRSPRDPNETAKIILSHKNHRWLYEREWRIFATILGKLEYKNPRCVARVYIGSRVPEVQRGKIERRLKRLKIPLHIQTLNGYAMSFRLARAKRD